MLAAVFQGAGLPLAIETVPDPAPAAGQIVVKVGRCGICGSDLHMSESHTFTFPRGATPGHEFSGEVVAIGSEVEGVRIGQRFAVMPYLGCGRCAECLAGNPTFCTTAKMHGVAVRGGYAEFALADPRFSIPIPEAFDLADGALVEPLAVALHGLRMSGIRQGDRILVLGAGPIGLAAVFWAKRAGAGRVVVATRSRRREQVALAMGADAFVTTSDGGVETTAREAAGGPIDLVFECAGMPGTLDLATLCVRPRGAIVVLGVCWEPDVITPLRAITKEVRLQFSLTYDRREFEIAVEAMDRGAVEPRVMVTDTVGLADLPTAFEALKGSSPQCKVLIDPWRR